MGYWTWELQPALKGIARLDNLDPFCVYFLLSLEGDNHLPLHLAHFVRDVASKVRKRMEIGTSEFDEIAPRIDSGVICGYIQFRTGCMAEVWDWMREHGTLWIASSYGPVHFETNSFIVGHHGIKAWQGMIHAAVQYVLISMCGQGAYTYLSQGNSLIPAEEFWARVAKRQYVVVFCTDVASPYSTL
jgi:hypothetical protein